MATILVNKFFHEMNNGSANTSLEPLNEVYFKDDKDLYEITEQFKILKEDLLATEEFDELFMNFSETPYQKCVNLIWRHPSMKKITKLIQKKFGFSNVVRMDSTTQMAQLGMATDPMRSTVSNFRSVYTYMNQNPKMYQEIIDSNVITPKRSRLLSQGKNPDKVDKIIKRYQTNYARSEQKLFQLIANSKDGDFIDDYGNINGLNSDIASRAIILSKDSIKFDPDKIKVVFKWYINPIMIKLCDPKELTSLLLHEIGHNFAAFLVPDIPFELANTSKTPSRRAHEIFADRFAALHGYGYDLNSIFSYSSLLQTLDDEELEKQRKKIPPEEQWSTWKGLLHDEHPFVINDIKTLLNQLYYTKQNDPTLTENQKLQIDKQIENLTRLLKQYQNDYKYSDALARHQKRTSYDKRAQKLINPAKMDQVFLKLKK